MAEVGLVTFAQSAYQIASASMPAYRSKYSKHVFTQPQLLAILCLMRYDDWTFRQAEVRLGEHRELRQALELESVPDHTTLYRFLRRLDERTLQRILEATLQLLPPQSEANGPTVAVDGTGLMPCAVSTFFVKRLKDHGSGYAWRHWVKWLVAVDVQTQMVLAQQARHGPYNDCANLRSLLDEAAHGRALALVLADAEFDSERNHRFIRQVHGAESIIPAKRGKPNWKIKGVRAQMRADFPAAAYAQRNLVETVISVVKRKLSARAPGRSLTTQRSQALLLGVAYNIYRALWRLLSETIRTELDRHWQIV
ncbi:MAG TPA: transposase [Anaerolineales bacterium]|nr:transposase [Anaerolineales bacterium]